ncbi:MAG: hypothetical protein AB1767_12105 [Bacillota bacterium]
MIKDCPEVITWQAVVDGEEDNPWYWGHLDSCPACRAVYREIEAAAGLASGLLTEAVLPPAAARRILNRVKPFPAGLIVALLFSLLGGSVALLEPGGLSWWFSVGVVRQWGLILDAAIGLLFLVKNLDPLVILATALLLVGLEVAILYKIKLVEG